MRHADLTEGGIYAAKISGRIVPVRIDSIVERWEPASGWARSTRARGRTVYRYGVTNLATGRKTTFRSAQKFRRRVSLCEKCGEAIGAIMLESGLRCTACAVDLDWQKGARR